MTTDSQNCPKMEFQKIQNLFLCDLFSALWSRWRLTMAFFDCFFAVQ
jgi:hypothetical protein